MGPRSSRGPTAPPRERAARGSLSRDRVVGAALELVDTGGAEALSIRQLASALGVSPMAVYRHVRDREDLLAEVVDVQLARAWRPRRSTEDWQEWTKDAANRLRRFLVSQPVALELYLQRPVTSPAALERMDAMLGALQGGLGDADLARRAYAAIHTYTIGFASLEVSRRHGEGRVKDDPVARELAGFTSQDQFRDGLTSLLMGYVALSGTHGSRSPEDRPSR